MLKKFLVLTCLSTVLSFSVSADCLDLYQDQLNKKLKVVSKISTTLFITTASAGLASGLVFSGLVYELSLPLMSTAVITSTTSPMIYGRRAKIVGAYSFALGKTNLTKFENENDCEYEEREIYQQRFLEDDFNRFSLIIDDRLLGCGLVSTLADLEKQVKASIIDLDQKSSFCPTVDGEKTILSSNSFINLVALNVAIINKHESCIKSLSEEQ